MIIAPQFIILHMGRTGGDAVKQIVGSLQIEGLRIDSLSERAKHAFPEDRGIDTEGKALVCGIRRLPYWELSVMHHRARFPRPDSNVAESIKTADEIIAINRGERGLRRILKDKSGRPRQIDYWLRTEHLREDLFEFLSKFYSLSAEQKQLIMQTPTKKALPYERSLSHWFTSEQLERLYAKSPTWSSLEKEQYGNLLTLEDSIPFPPGESGTCTGRKESDVNTEDAGE